MPRIGLAKDEDEARCSSDYFTRGDFTQGDFEYFRQKCLEKRYNSGYLNSLHIINWP